MPTAPLSDDEYRKKFSSNASIDPGSIHAKALELALDTRKFEIELYWKRASYFWTFIGASLAGYIAIQASASANKTHSSILLSCAGLTFSFAWLLANRGSKYWQENWENHVNLLEDAAIGPLFKVTLTRNDPIGWAEHLHHIVTGPSPYSVSKINQLLSLFMTCVWLVLLATSLPNFSLQSPINWTYFFEVNLAVFSCIGMLLLSRSYQGGHWHKGRIRTSKINNQPGT